MNTTTLYIVRHGETEWNKVGRRQGHLDSPLTKKGVEQAQALGRLLKTSLPAGVPLVVETSPLDRVCGLIAVRDSNEVAPSDCRISYV